MCWLISGDHVPGLVHLQKGQAIRSAGQSRTVVPVVFLSIVELRLVLPVKVECPGTIAQVVANTARKGVHTAHSK